MWPFSIFKSLYIKSQSIVIIKNLLKIAVKEEIANLDPANTAYVLIENVWNSMPDVFNGKFGQQPHRITVAASALSNGLLNTPINHPSREALIFSLGTILSDLEKHGDLYPLNSLDKRLINESVEVFYSATKFS